MTLRKRVEELDSPLNSSTELEAFLKRVADLHKDLYMELMFAAEVLQQNLGTLPVADSKNPNGAAGAVSSRIRARRVANNLRRAAEASKYGAGQTVKTWRSFTMAFAPEIENRRRAEVKKRPHFKVEQ